MSIVCLDTHIIIWGIKKEASPGQEMMIPKAKRFLEWLEEEKKTIIIPVPIITELLVPLPIEEHSSFLQVIHEKFRVYPVDEIAAVKTAEIWQQMKENTRLNEYRKASQITREEMKFDFQIAAVAITRRAECIYSNDPHLKTFVGDLITVREMPDIGIQTKLELD